jgi:hypothetical protein
MKWNEPWQPCGAAVLVFREVPAQQAEDETQMGVDYDVRPLASELARDGGRWLRERGVVLPERVTQGQFPTYQEAHSALVAVEGWHVAGGERANGSGWRLRVTAKDQHATLEADERFKGSRPGVPAFYFSRGWPCLVVAILAKLASVCGPFVVVSPDALAVVLPGAHPEQAWVNLCDVDELP